MVGRARPERVFSVGHTGGDLSLPDEVKAKVMPKPFPILESDLRLSTDLGAPTCRQLDGAGPRATGGAPAGTA